MLGILQDVSNTDLLGLVGVAVYVGSYFGLQAGIIRGQGYLYATLNIVAAGFVLFSLMGSFNLSSAVIQVTYIGISFFGIARYYLMTRAISFSDDERVFLRVVAPGLNNHRSRQLLDLGVWVDAVPGTLLAEEGNSVSQLCFKLRGRADVIVNGRTVAKLGAHSLVGEMSILTGNPASASVRVTEPSRLFAVNVEKLNKYLMRNNDVRQELEARFAAQVTNKLTQANAVISANA